LLRADRFAQLVTGADDVLAVLGQSERPAVGAGDGAAPGEYPRHPTDGFGPETRRVYDAFPDPRMVFGAGPGRRVRAAGGRGDGSLAVLQLHGLADQDGSLWRRVRPERP